MGKLIRLELYNFKSYRGHHVMHFGDSYFTSIIGPNGSGKSNSMDAISFVLGMKSRNLRSTQLSDLVYRGRVLKTSKINADGTATEADGQTNSHTNGDVNGHADGAEDEDDEPSTQTSTRNDPQTAWVMAVYEDDAGDEQRWKRSITTNNQSEYRVNNRVVTAKQYNDALEEESILIKARNFLVFQGEVEKVAEQSPKDLTMLVEQISGSLEYKADYERLKLEYEQAMEEQGEKLQRRRGMNTEITEVKKHKAEAEKYEAKLREKDNAVINQVLWKLYHFQRQIDEAEAEIQKHQNELKEHKRGVEKYNKGLEQASKEKALVQKDLSKIERTMKQKDRDIDEKENGLVPIDEKITITKKRLDNQQERIQEITKQRDKHAKEVEHLKKQLADVQKAQKRWEQEWDKTTSQQGRQLTDADQQEYSKLKGDVNKRTAADQSEVNSLDRQIKADEEMVNSLKSKAERAQAQLDRFDEEIEELQSQRKQTQKRVKEAQADINTTKKEINAKNSERLRVEQRRTELDELIHKTAKKLQEVQGVQKQSHREREYRTAYRNMKSIFSGVKGIVHDICKPKEKRFEVAVSTVLGKDWNSVIVDSVKTAEECTEYLKAQSKLQMTFIPLDTIHVDTIDRNLTGMHRGMRLAIDTIEYDHQWERAMFYCCGNTMVCNDMNVAKELCFKRKVQAKAVDLQGHVISKGGLMTGGRGPDDRNMRRWDDAELEQQSEQLRANIEKWRNEVMSLPKSYEGTDAGLQGELAGLEDQLSHATEHSKTLDRNIASKQSQRHFEQSQLDEALPKYRQKSQGLDTLRANLKTYRDRISGIEDQVFRDFCRRNGYNNIRDYEAQQGSMMEVAREEKEMFTRQNSRLSAQLRTEEKLLEDVETRIRSIKDAGKRDEQNMKAFKKDKDAIQNDLDTLNAELEQLQEQEQQLKESLEEKSKAVTKAKREYEKQNASVVSVEKSILNLQTDMRRIARDRYRELRKCKLDNIKIPLTKASKALSALPIDDPVGQGEDEDPDAMELDEGPSSSALQLPDIPDYGIEVNFDPLEDELKDDTSSAVASALEDAIKTLDKELSAMDPHSKAPDRLQRAQEKFETAEKDLKTARRSAQKAKDEFEAVKEKRSELFEKAFEWIANEIKKVYRELTRGAGNAGVEGTAYLTTELSEEPYLAGLKYHAMPPLKRFRDMEHLSGGEKTIAALALLFAIHAYRPSPFFVLDEVDAALDTVNVARVANYVRSHAGPGMQFIVISLKMGMFVESETLVGVMRDQGVNSSRALTLDLRKYQPNPIAVR